LLDPDCRVIAYFAYLEPLAGVVERVPVQTRRIDTLDEISAIELLTIDVEGFELTVFPHGCQRLAWVVAVHTYLSFICLYEGQPSFGDVDLELRSQGPVPRALKAVERWAITPALVGGDPRRPLNPLLEADVAYVRD
jgi:hypothetical protein